MKQSLVALGGMATAPLLACTAPQSDPEENIVQDQSATPENEAYWSNVRKSFPVDPGMVYFNTGALGLLPVEVATAVSDYFRQYSTYGVSVLRDAREKREVTREALATFLGADSDEIAFTLNATEGLEAIINGIKMAPGDEVLMTTHEYPLCLDRWHRRSARYGIKLSQVRMPNPPDSPEQVVDLFRKAITPKTKVLFFCHITRGPGLLYPIKDLCKLAAEHGLVSAIDGAQAVGIHPVNLHDLGCDLYASSLHKWALAPIGTGALYVRKGFQDRFWPAAGGTGPWDASVAGLGHIENVGTFPEPLLVGVKKGLEMINRIGFANIYARARMLSDYLKFELEKRPAIQLVTSTSHTLSGAGITSFEHQHWDRRPLRIQLRNTHDFIMSVDFSDGHELTRISTHFYNLRAEIDLFLEALDANLS